MLISYLKKIKQRLILIDIVQRRINGEQNDGLCCIGLRVDVFGPKCKPFEWHIMQGCYNNLLPCQSFLAGSGPASPTAACCQGATTATKQLFASTPEVRKAVCECILKWGRDVRANPENGKRIRDSAKSMSFTLARV
jgi:hypothetical protein